MGSEDSYNEIDSAEINTTENAIETKNADSYLYNSKPDNNKKRKESKKIITPLPLIISILLLFIGVTSNILLLIMTSDERLFMLGTIDPLVMVRTCYIMWSVGLLMLPYGIYFLSHKQKDAIWLVIVVFSIFIMAGCLYASIKDETKVVGPGVQHFTCFSNGVYRVVIEDDVTASGDIMQHFYVRDDEFYYYWYAAGTDHAFVEWRDDGAMIVQDGEDCLLIDYSEFYVK